MLTIDKNQFIRGFLWKYLERFSYQGVLFTVQVVMARLLSPSDFGTIAIITVFILLTTIFVQGGMNSALIQKKDADELDFSTVFFTYLILSFVAYLLLFFTSPLIASFFRENKLVNVLRVLPVILIFGAVNSVQIAYTSRLMLFKPIFVSTLVASLLSGVIGIFLAYEGCGVWALVVQQIISYLITTIMLFLTIKWRPAWKFSFVRLKPLYSYGWKVMFSSLCSFINEDSYSLAIGKIYSKETLGYYNRGYVFPSVLVISNLNGTLMSVLFPTLASCQSDPARMRLILKRTISVSSFFVFPAMAGLIAVAEPFISLILTDKWLPSVPFLRIESLFFATIPALTSIVVALNSLGRSDLSLKLNLFKVFLTIGTVILFAHMNLYLLLGMKVFVSVILVITCLFISRAMIGYGFSDFFSDVTSSLVLSVVTGGLMFFICFLPFGKLEILALQIVSGTFFYLEVSYFLRITPFMYVIESLKTFRRSLK